MIALHAEFQRYNPLRPLDWRWQRAGELVANGRKYCRRRDDEITGLAVRYLRSLNRCNRDRDAQLLRGDMSELWQAHVLRQRNEAPTWLIEAHVLTGQLSSDIANRTAVSPAVIRLYEQLFFDVRDRLGARTYIHLHALARPTIDDSREASLGWILKTLAYHGGALMLGLAKAALLEPGVDSRSARPLEHEDHQRDKLRLLAGLLALPQDVSPEKLLPLLADLLKTTRTDGANCQSPFALSCERIATESLHNVDQYVLDDAAADLVNTDIDTDMVPVGAEKREAA